MTHSLFADENKRRGEPDARRLVAEFPDRAQAIAAAQARLDQDVRDLWREGTSPDELVRLWTLFGEDAYVVPDDPSAPFSGVDYVRSRAAALAAGIATEPDAPDDEEDEDESESPEDAERVARATRSLERFVRAIGIVTCVGFAIAGATVLQFAGRAWSAYHDAAGWLETTGVIHRARVENYDVAIGDPNAPDTRPKIYVVRIAFVATIEGREHKLIADAPRQTRPEKNTRYEAETIAERYRKGDRIAVYYQPGDPENARLTRAEAASLSWAIAGIAIGLGALALGLVGAWYMAFHYRDSPPATETSPA